MSQVHVPSIPAGGQLGASVSQTSVSVTPPQHSHEQPAVTITTVKAASVQPKPALRTLTDWIEHTSADGRRYYFNRRTRLSTWDKPLELMTPVERTDATTDWKEFTSLDGRTYYYNKVTKQSVWTIPDELKLAREQAEKASIQGMQSEPVDSQTSVSAPSVAKAPCSTDTPTSTVHG
ncbi:hypothetical protein LWI29_036699 [Acer saccharum]|uniref:WW domain-containing protein n=1 Tax=Acer saccharum TaxID=4024 RepID=A0AA39S1A8_ACESA|nr:hypothetical protein LWI29_036699 [Acer saccharum]